MGKGIGAVVVRREHGKLTVQGLGQTPRGQRYIKKSIPLEVKDMADEKFKGEMAAAVNEMLG